jgi:hypothetical protein
VDVVGDDRAIDEWIGQAIAHVRTLPAK